MPRRRSYRRKPTKRRRTKVTIKRGRKQTENKFIDALSKIIRLLILIAICAFIIYRLFLPEKKGDQKSVQEEVAKLAIDTTIHEPIEKKIELDSLPKEQALDYLLKEVFDTFNLDDSWIARNGKILKVQLPAELPAVSIIWEIIQKIEQLDLKVLNSEENLKANKSSISIGTDDNTFLTVIFYKNVDLQRRAGKIAIIIDDFGYYENKTIDNFLKLDYPIALSIIPGQKHSIKIAQEAKKYNKPIMIHLPMEALEEKVEDSEFTIMSNMSDSVIASRVQKALAYLPDAVGINNHMGSKATADDRVMNIIISELKSKEKFFVDSRTSGKSVAPSIAEKYNLKFAVNDAFLERNKNEDMRYIQSKLAAGAKIARKQGKAVLIGHPYKETIKVLTEELPKLEKQGFKIVPVTDIVR